MQAFLNDAFNIGSLQLPNRLIQGPLAGFSCAPFRQLYYQFLPPAYCVSEMISAQDVLYKHSTTSRYLYRAPIETRLCYQLAGQDPKLMAEAAKKLENLGADLIDINCGCPKAKIRRKGAGSALLDQPEKLANIVHAVRDAISCPLTVKLRIHGDDRDLNLAQSIEQSGADALIVHGRRWTEDYDTACHFHQIAQIKKAVRIPVIANGDIADRASLAKAIAESACDGFMIARAGTGQPWLYQQLLDKVELHHQRSVDCFLTHLHGLSLLESEHQAVLQSKTLIRYYFAKVLSSAQLQFFYTLKTLHAVGQFTELLADNFNRDLCFSGEEQS